jgi:hypothetical protein
MKQTLKFMANLVILHCAAAATTKRISDADEGRERHNQKTRPPDESNLQRNGWGGGPEVISTIKCTGDAYVGSTRWN